MFLYYANGLAEKGYEVTLYCNTMASVFSINPKVRFRRIPWSGKVGTILFALLHNFGATPLVADIIPLALALSFRNQHVLYFAQDLDTAYYTSPLLIALMRFLIRWGLTRKNISTVAVSNRLAQELLQLTGNAPTVLPNGIDHAIFYREPNADLLASKHGKKALLLHARSDHRKGFDLAHDVVKKIVQQGYSNLVVWTVGERIPDSLFRGIEYHDFGYVDEPQLRQIMSSADIFLSPSRHEGFGLFPLEAMACGCPVVTTTAVPYAIHEKNALVAPPEDGDALAGHVKTLLQDDAMCSQLCQGGKMAATQHSLADAIPRFQSELPGR